MKDYCLLCYSQKLSGLTQLGHMERQISFPQGGLLLSSNSSQRHPSWQPQQCLTKHLVNPWPRQVDTRNLSSLSKSRYVKDCLASSVSLCYRMLFGHFLQDTKENTLLVWIFPVWDSVRRSNANVSLVPSLSVLSCYVTCVKFMVLRSPKGDSHDFPKGWETESIVGLVLTHGADWRTIRTEWLCTPSTSGTHQASWKLMCLPPTQKSQMSEGKMAKLRACQHNMGISLTSLCIAHAFPHGMWSG